LPHLRSAAGTAAWYSLRLLILGAVCRIDSMAAEAGKPARLLALAPSDLVATLVAVVFMCLNVLFW
jgi:hypothetical protein